MAYGAAYGAESSESLAQSLSLTDEKYTVYRVLTRTSWVFTLPSSSSGLYNTFKLGYVRDRVLVTLYVMLKGFPVNYWTEYRLPQNIH